MQAGLRQKTKFSVIQKWITACLLWLAALPMGADAQVLSPLVIYSPHGPEIMKLAKQHFEKKYPTVTIAWEYRGAEDIFQRVMNEHRDGGGDHAGDIWWGGPHYTFMQAAGAGALTPYQPTWHDRVAAQFKDAGHHWYSDMQTPLSMIYNKNILAEKSLPRDWDDLLKPVFKNKLVLRYPKDSGTMRALFGALIQFKKKQSGSIEKSFRWLAELGKQTGKYADHSQIVFQSLGQGLFPLSIWNVAETSMRAKQGFPVSIVFPESGMPILSDGIALIRKNRPHPFAKDFYEEITSVEFASILAKPPYSRVPTRFDVDKALKPDYLNDSRYKPMLVDWAEIGSGIDSWLELWEKEIAGKRDTP